MSNSCLFGQRQTAFSILTSDRESATAAKDYLKAINYRDAFSILTSDRESATFVQVGGWWEEVLQLSVS